MFQARKKKKVLKKYIERLPLDLEQRYGAKECYSKGLLEMTLNDLKYPALYRDYAAVFYLSKEVASEYLCNKDLVEQLVKEIAGIFFNGDLGFTLKIAMQRAVGNTGHCFIGADPGAGASN